MDIFKIAAIALCGVITASIVRGYKTDFALYIIIATVLAIFGYILYQLTSVFQFLGYVYDRISYGKAFFPILLKVLAVAYIADFVAQICRDAGENAIGDKVELAGKVIIFYLAIPVMMSVIETLTKLYSS
ncbi:MAG: stage III sporulation protein AD [Eubacteriales bacterium]|nr:stage III sporulation protein AD [Eubacteriales bacterium]